MSIDRVNDVVPLAPRSPDQRALVERSQSLIPGGTTCAIVPPEGLEFIIERGEGAYVHDVDGRRFLDFLLGGGPLLLGHGNPRLISAIVEQAGRGTHHMGLTRRAVELVERFVRYVPCAEMARFTSSGSEATFHALRLARAVTGRQGIIKFDGAYHGHHDLAAWSYEFSPTRSPEPYRESAGIQAGVGEQIVVLPFNDARAVRDALSAEPERFAAVICEPVQRAIPPQPGFLEALREVCDRTGTVLVFDEIVTGFRLAPGGAQEHYGVVPDLATFGKALTGGLPFSALLGRRGLMEHLEMGSPEDQFSFHCGTYNGYALAVACAHVMLDVLVEESGVDHLAALGELAREKVERVFVDAGIPVQVCGAGPVLQPYFTDQPVHDHRAVRASDLAFSDALHRKMYEAGIYKSFSKTYLGLIHDDSHIGELTDAMRWAVRELGAGKRASA